MGVHDKEKYPAVKALLGIPEDEPIFILRAQDRFYTPSLAVYEQLYISGCKAIGVSESTEEMWRYADAVDQCRDDGRKWQNKNKSKVKIPD